MKVPKVLPRSDTLSRLKGIETSGLGSLPDLFTEFRYAFPFEGNWNFFEELLGQFVFVFCSDTLSRLKGIETHSPQNRGRAKFGSDTLSRLKGIETKTLKNNFIASILVQIRFPVWRELKHELISESSQVSKMFRYAFPFEGNWNRGRRPLIVTLPSGSDTLSRLKGIETHSTAPLSEMISVSSDTLSRLKGIETWELSSQQNSSKWFRYAFPFEGNWNL